MEQWKITNKATQKINDHFAGVREDFRNGRHEHLCPRDEEVWQCHQITHCKRSFIAVCPEHDEQI